MLILSRKTQESVVVGGADGFHRMLTVTVLEVTGRRVRLGFEADPSVVVHREEVWDRVGAEVLRPAGEVRPMRANENSS